MEEHNIQIILSYSGHREQFRQNPKIQALLSEGRKLDSA